MSNCPNCNREIPQDDATCPACEELESESPQARKINLESIFGTNAKGRTPDSFTKEDLVAGLRTAADGTPMEDFLPSVKWEQYTAGLLEVLTKKHLVFPNEIDQALESPKKDK